MKPHIQSEHLSSRRVFCPHCEKSWSWRRWLATFLAILTVYQTVAVPVTEASFWEARRVSMAASATGPLEPANLNLKASMSSYGVSANLPLSGFSIPSDLGQTVETRWSSNAVSRSPLIIHIQDAHEIAGAQQNAAEILKSIREELKTNSPVVVAVEGAWGPVDSDRLAAFPNKDAKVLVAESFLAQKRLFGEEARAIMDSPGSWKIVGVEDKDLYLANGAAKSKVETAQPRVLPYIDSLQSTIRELSVRLDSTDLRVFKRRTREYNAGRLPLTDYLKSLTQIPHIALTPNLAKILELSEIEKTVRSEWIQDERKALIEQAAKRLGEKDLKVLLDESVAFRLGRVSPLTYHQFLINVAHGLNVPVPNLVNYARYLKFYESINVDKIPGELNALQGRVGDVLASSAESKTLFRLERWLSLQEKAWKLDLTPDEFSAYESLSPVEGEGRVRGKAVSGWPYITQILSSLMKTAGLPSNLPPMPAQISSHAGSIKDFYRLAAARSGALVRNTLHLAMSGGASSAPVIILIAGGYHTSDITHLFKEKNQPYMVIRPNLEAKKLPVPKFVQARFDSEAATFRAMSNIFQGSVSPNILRAASSILALPQPNAVDPSGVGVFAAPIEGTQQVFILSADGTLSQISTSVFEGTYHRARAAASKPFAGLNAKDLARDVAPLVKDATVVPAEKVAGAVQSAAGMGVDIVGPVLNKSFWNALGVALGVATIGVVLAAIPVLLTNNHLSFAFVPVVLALPYLVQSAFIFMAGHNLLSKGELIPELRDFPKMAGGSRAMSAQNGTLVVNVELMSRLPNFMQRWFSLHEMQHLRHPNWRGWLGEFLVALTDFFTFFQARTPLLKSVEDLGAATALRDMIDKANLTPEAATNPAEYAKRVKDENIRLGETDGILSGRTLEEAVDDSPIEIKPEVSRQWKINFVLSISRGEKAWIIFKAGRATRLKMPAIFDLLGIGGLIRWIISTFSVNEDEIPLEVDYAERVKRAVHGDVKNAFDISIGQADPLQLRYDLTRLVEEVGEEAGVTLEQVLAGVNFVDIVNADNRSAIANQWGGIDFAGFSPERVYLLEQPEEGGLKRMSDGTLQWYDAEKFPAGHGVPVVQMARDSARIYHFNRQGKMVPLGKTLGAAFRETGVKRRLFVQVNDMLPLGDMAMIGEWEAAEEAIQKDGVGMVMEMKRNLMEPSPEGGLRHQKGGAALKDPRNPGKKHLRDTLALKNELRPAQVSRMLYVFTEAADELNWSDLIYYFNPRKTREGVEFMTREAYSGDLSSKIRGGAATMMRKEGSELVTFKMRQRKEIASRALDRQIAQPGFMEMVEGLADRAHRRRDPNAVPISGRSAENRRRNAEILGIDPEKADVLSQRNAGIQFGVTLVAGHPLDVTTVDKKTVPGPAAKFIAGLSREIQSVTGGLLSPDPSYSHLNIAAIVRSQTRPVSEKDLAGVDFGRVLAVLAAIQPFDVQLRGVEFGDQRDGGIVLVGEVPGEVLAALRKALMDAGFPPLKWDQKFGQDGSLRVYITLAHVNAGVLATLSEKQAQALKAWVEAHHGLSSPVTVKVGSLKVVSYFQRLLDRVVAPDIEIPMGQPAPVTGPQLHDRILTGFQGSAARPNRRPSMKLFGFLALLGVAFSPGRSDAAGVADLGKKAVDYINKAAPASWIVIAIVGAFIAFLLISKLLEWVFPNSYGKRAGTYIAGPHDARGIVVDNAREFSTVLFLLEEGTDFNGDEGNYKLKQMTTDQLRGWRSGHRSQYSKNLAAETHGLFKRAKKAGLKVDYFIGESLTNIRKTVKDAENKSNPRPGHQGWFGSPGLQLLVGGLFVVGAYVALGSWAALAAAVVIFVAVVVRAFRRVRSDDVGGPSFFGIIGVGALTLLFGRPSLVQAAVQGFLDKADGMGGFLFFAALVTAGAALYAFQHRSSPPVVQTVKIPEVMVEISRSMIAILGNVQKPIHGHDDLFDGSQSILGLATTVRRSVEEVKGALGGSSPAAVEADKVIVLAETVGSRASDYLMESKEYLDDEGKGIEKFKIEMAQEVRNAARELKEGIDVLKGALREAGYQIPAEPETQSAAPAAEASAPKPAAPPPPANGSSAKIDAVRSRLDSIEDSIDGARVVLARLEARFKSDPVLERNVKKLWNTLDGISYSPNPEVVPPVRQMRTALGEWKEASQRTLLLKSANVLSRVEGIGNLTWISEDETETKVLRDIANIKKQAGAIYDLAVDELAKTSSDMVDRMEKVVEALSKDFDSAKEASPETPQGQENRENLLKALKKKNEELKISVSATVQNLPNITEFDRILGFSKTKKILEPFQDQNVRLGGLLKESPSPENFDAIGGVIAEMQGIVAKAIAQVEDLHDELTKFRSVQPSLPGDGSSSTYFISVLITLLSVAGAALAGDSGTGAHGADVVGALVSLGAIIGGVLYRRVAFGRDSGKSQPLVTAGLFAAGFAIPFFFSEQLRQLTGRLTNVLPEAVRSATARLSGGSSGSEAGVGTGGKPIRNDVLKPAQVESPRHDALRLGNLDQRAVPEQVPGRVDHIMVPLSAFALSVRTGDDGSVVEHSPGEVLDAENTMLTIVHKGDSQSDLLQVGGERKKRIEVDVIDDIPKADPNQILHLEKLSPPDQKIFRIVVPDSNPGMLREGNEGGVKIDVSVVVEGILRIGTHGEGTSFSLLHAQGDKEFDFSGSLAKLVHEVRYQVYEKDGRRFANLALGFLFAKGPLTRDQAGIMVDSLRKMGIDVSKMTTVASSDGFLNLLNIPMPTDMGQELHDTYIKDIVTTLIQA